MTSRALRTRIVLPAALVASAGLVLTGCATEADTAASSDDATIHIVASTNVYGDIATTIGGDAVEVTSIIDSSAQDPHSYEATAQDQLALSKADIVIENGGGYDPFIDTLLEASGNTDAVVLNVSELSGLMPGVEGAEHEHAEDEHADDTATEEASTEEAHAEDEHAEGDGHDHIEGFNEHVWYSLPAVDTFAHELAHELAELDSGAPFEDNYTEFAAGLGTIEDSLTAIAADHEGDGAAITEPVPLYLLEAAGLVNKTPEAFSEAIEEGTDVSPTVLAETLALFQDNSVAVLAYNEQTAGPETEEVRAAAESAGVPVVSFAETLPEDTDYLGWMTSNVEALQAALAS